MVNEALGFVIYLTHTNNRFKTIFPGKEGRTLLVHGVT